jgi:ribulose bisphosphate carboxylase small subunit
MEQTITITFTEKGKTITTSSTMDKNITAYSAVSALEALSEGIKHKLGEYMQLNGITPETPGFFKKIEKIKISDFEESI